VYITLCKLRVLFYKLVILQEVEFSIPIRILNTYSAICFEADESNTAVGKPHFLHLTPARRRQDFRSA
jgi:hypothetical protein